MTGAGLGIGAAIVRQSVTAGHSVVATDVNAEALAALHTDLPGIETLQLDVRNLEAWEQVAEQAEARGGPVDVLINNAGVCFPGSAEKVSALDDRQTVEVNLVGAMHGIRVFLPRFLERRRGHVINVASMAAFAPAPELAAYCATKHALRAYTHSCALDHRHQPIHWTVVCPSAVETPMLQGMRRKRAGLVVFAENPMPAARVAEAIVDTIAKPRSEVLVPAARGKLIRFLGLFPSVLARGMDDAERRGQAALDRAPR